MKRKVFILSSIIFILVAAIGTLFLLPNKAEATEATDENGITWNFTVYGQYIEYLTYSSGAIPDDGKVVIPSKLTVGGQEYTVESIGVYSGSYQSMFSNASYTNKNKIKEIVIPDTVKYVRDYAFYNLSYLTSVDFGHGVTELGNWIFTYTNVSEVHIPNSVTYVGYYAFAGYRYNNNYTIRKIYIGDGIRLYNLKDMISYTPYVTEWAVNEESEKYIAVDGEIYSKDGKTLYAIPPRYSSSTYTVKEEVTAIGEYAFYGNTSISTVNLHEGITSIGGAAFYGCSNLRSIDLPSQLTEIEQSAFAYSGLRGELVLPEGIKRIGSDAFSNCSGLTGTLHLPEGLTTIEYNAFSNCNGLTGDLIIPDSVTSIGSGAFRYCSGFNGQLIVGDGVTTIEEGTFAVGYSSYNGTNNFTRITLGSGVRVIKREAFNNLSDFWINCLEGEVAIDPRCGGDYSKPYAHYLNGTHRVTIGTSEGIRVINVDTDTEVESGQYDCETTFRYKVVIEPGYDYPDLKIVEINNNELENAVTHTYVPGQVYEFSPLLRDRKIYIESIKEGNDLSLRTFITELNYVTISKPRTPFAELNQGEFKYVHTKNPLRVENNDDVTFRIRVYNESLTKLSADEISVHIPEGMRFDPENVVNAKNGWTLASDGVVKSTKLENNLIGGYYGNGIFSYKDLDIVLKVTDTSSEEEIYKTVFAEITRESLPDADSTPGNVVVSQNYMINEILDSNSNSAIVSQEDDDDFDTVVLNAKFRVQYSIRINKIDSKTDEVLKGAKFKLTSYGTNELEITEGNDRVLKTFNDGETIATAISDENGAVDFGGLTSYGEGENEYLIEEIDAPSGYLTNIGKKMKVRVVKSIIDKEKGTYGVKVFCGSTDYAIDTSTYEFTPVRTAEQLAKIGSGETVNVDGMDYEYNIDTNYKLIDDIDLSEINWTPIRNEIKGVFDGDGHKISNLTIVATDPLTYSEVGLISTFTGIVENLTFENPNIHIGDFADNVESNSGYTGVGCFAGVMRQGGIYNCKTTITEGASSSITAPVDNIGGLVGHTVPEGLVTVIDCENNVSVVGQESFENKSKNVGGIIGCALGSISVQSSVNNGYVQAGEYNAGGLVGFVNPSDYREMLLSAGYDEDNKRIDLLVENQAAEGQYNLTLEVRDRKTQALIGGATYEIDKVEDVVMTQLLETGSLKLFDKVIEYSGRDIYFLTEDETIEGYSKLNGIIKVVIERYWDDNAKEYKVRAEATIVSHKEYEEFAEQRETNEQDVKGQEFDRGSVFTDANIVNANWNGRKVEFINNTNNGTVQSMKMNAAGMLGTSYGLVDIENCTNNGTILSRTKAAGILSELRTVDGTENGTTIEGTQNTTSNSEIKDCKNTGEIYTTGTDEYEEGSEAGILSEVTGYAIVKNAINSGKITGNSRGNRHIGGIVGAVAGGIQINDSTNKGTVTNYQPSDSYKYSMVGGIIGQLRCMSGAYEKLTFKNTYARINGCKNTGEITGTYATAGIFGGALGGNEVTITGCEVKGTPENKLRINMTQNGGCAGILALDGCKHTNIRDNKVEYCNVEVVEESSSFGDTSKSCAGILADVDRYVSTSGMSFKPEDDTLIETITVNNNSVKNSSIIDRNKECGGIVATTYLDASAFTSINNCLVENTEILNYNTGNSTYNISGGIFAGGGWGNGKVEIKYCLVDNSRIIKTNPDGGPGPGQATIGGIFGRANYLQGITIENCDLKDSYIYDNALDSTSGSPGGIFGTCYGITGDIVIRGCNIINSTIREFGQNVGGFIGGVEEVSGKIIVENCDAIETNISREIPGDYSTVYNCVGYVIGFTMASGSIELSNINIIGKDLPKGSEGRTTIISDGANIGAVIGNAMSYGKLTASNINVKNIDIINTIGINGWTSLDAAQIGGFAGIMMSGADITDFTLENCDVRGNQVYNSGGITATLFGSSNFKNITIKDTNITTGLMLDDGISTYGHAAGLVSEQNGNCNYENCNIENCRISCGCVGAAGMISCAQGSTKVKDCTIKNIELIDSWENPQGEVMVGNGYQHYRPFGGVASIADSGFEADNVVVDGIKCHAKYAHIGGIVGYTTNAKINNCTVKNADFYSERSISNTNGAMGGIVADGCSISEFTNNKVKDSKLVTTTHLLGGLLGYLGNSATISDCEVDNVELVHKNLSHWTDPTYQSSGPSLGGIVGVIPTSTVEIKNTTIKNSSVKAENPDNIPMQVGGVVGYSYKSSKDVTLNNVNVINTKVESEVTGSATGGFIGIGGAIIKDSAVKGNSVIKGKGHVAGFVGVGPVTVNDSEVANTTIESLEGFEVAGIVAIGNERDSTGTFIPGVIEDVEIKNTTITGRTGNGYSYNHAGGVAGCYAGTIDGVTMTNIDITTGGVAAGVVGIQENLGEIKDANLNDVNSTSTGSHAGGIAGISSSKISDATIKNSNVTANQMAGGIVATNNSSVIDDVELDNVKVVSSTSHAGGVIACTSNKVTNATVKNSRITGNVMAGGIAATSYAAFETLRVEGSTIKADGLHAGGIVSSTYNLVKDAEVKNSTITGKALTGGIVGVTCEEINTAKVEGSTIKSETMHAGGITSCTCYPVTGASTKDSTIITLSGSYESSGSFYPTCLGGLVGAGALENPVITTSTVENNTLTGATGTLVGKYIGAPTAINDALLAAEPVSNTNSLTGSSAPLQTTAPRTLNTQSAPVQTQQNTQVTDDEEDTEETTNNETSSTINKPEVKTDEETEDKSEESTEKPTQQVEESEESETSTDQTTKPETTETSATEPKTEESSDSTEDNKESTTGEKE